MILKTTPWQIEKRFFFLTLCCIAMALPTAAQKKPVQKRDKFEYSFELPVFVEKLKRELTYPLAWGNSDIKNFDRWRTEARKKVFECMMAPPRPAAAFDMRVEEEERAAVKPRGVSGRSATRRAVSFGPRMAFMASSSMATQPAVEGLPSLVQCRNRALPAPGR